VCLEPLRGGVPLFVARQRGSRRRLGESLSLSLRVTLGATTTAPEVVRGEENRMMMDV
jgi:hypothetical protein